MFVVTRVRPGLFYLHCITFCITFAPLNKSKMKTVKWLIAPALIIIYCCNSEKRVLKDPEKTARVVNKYLLTHQFDSDTVTRYIAGDTVVQLLIGYDTTFIPGDTIRKRDTIKLTQTIYKSVTKTDTVIKSVINNDLLKACQNQLMTAGYDKTQAVTAKDAADLQAKKWQMYFGILAAAVAIAIGLLIFFKR